MGLQSSMMPYRLAGSGSLHIGGGLEVHVNLRRWKLEMRTSQIGGTSRDSKADSGTTNRFNLRDIFLLYRSGLILLLRDISGARTQVRVSWFQALQSCLHQDQKPFLCVH